MCSGQKRIHTADESGCGLIHGKVMGTDSLNLYKCRETCYRIVDNLRENFYLFSLFLVKIFYWKIKKIILFHTQPRIQLSKCLYHIIMCTPNKFGDFTSRICFFLNHIHIEIILNSTFHYLIALMLKGFIGCRALYNTAVASERLRNQLKNSILVYMQTYQR